MLEIERERRELAAGLLREAAAVVRRGWTQGALAVDGRGLCVDPRSERAVGWSPAGAIHRAAIERGLMAWPPPGLDEYLRDLYRSASHLALDRLRAAAGRTSRRAWPTIGAWNDGPGQSRAAVVRTMDAAADELDREIANLCG